MGTIKRPYCGLYTPYGACDYYEILRGLESSFSIKLEDILKTSLQKVIIWLYLFRQSSILHN